MGEYEFEQLKKKILELEAELKSAKKFGLVWDKENTPEAIVDECKENIPFLYCDQKRTIKRGEINNLLIEGDNYHALTCLNMINFGEGFVDAVYIDPPYNTGAKDWKYNNDYVDSEDGFRHSKWLRMMERRLKLAREIMKPSGVIICAIDHYELFQLGMLMNEIFGENNRFGIITVVHKPEGRQFTKGLNPTNEFYLIYGKNRAFASLRNVPLTSEKKDEFNLSDNKGNYRLEPYMRLKDGDLNNRENKPNNWFPVYVSKDLKTISLFEMDDAYVVYPVYKGIEKSWSTSKQLFQENIDNDEVVAQLKNGKVELFKKYREQESIKTHWVKKEYNATVFGTKLLRTIIGDTTFNFPKSLYAVIDALKISSNKDAVVLDFFAGSGTTGHAVLELNKEDGGHRKFILCTNNESNICEEVTYPRLKTVLTGIRPDGSKYSDGLPGNLYYLKTDFLKNEDNVDQAKYNLVEKIDSLLCILEDTYDQVSKNAYSSHYKNGNKHLFIYNEFYNETLFNQFKAEVENTDGEKVVYVFDSENTFDNAHFDRRDIVEKPIPAKIYEIYKEIVNGIKRGE